MGTKPEFTGINRYQPGFTLIEIMVVVLILGLLASMIVPRVLGRAHDARIQTAKHDIQTLSMQLRIYKLDNFTYPTTEQGLESLISKPTISPVPENYREGGYINKLSKDPWKRDYVYLLPGKHGEFDLYSLGPDGTPDTTSGGDDVAPWKDE